MSVLFIFISKSSKTIAEFKRALKGLEDDGCKTEKAG
jgi:hypothetical protein